jgi:hypothetical protein
VCVCGAAWILLDSCLELGGETEAWWVKLVGKQRIFEDCGF